MFISLLFVGCAKQPLSNAGIYQYAGANFSSTNSPCMDGVLVAVDHSCAVPMVIEEKHPLIMVQCDMTREGASPWHEFNIIAIVDPSIEDPAGAAMMCMDPYTRVFIQKRP
tara:strand:- start:133 stop:465 length:333 start_codon:yes stop_codon:yes gene_type:complete